MKPEIVKKDAFKVVGMKTKFTMNNNTIAQLWGQFFPRMAEIQNVVNPGVAYGVCEADSDVDIEKTTDDTEFTEIACLEVSSFDQIPEGMVTKVIPANTYARFTHRGSLEGLHKTYNYIYHTWLPQSGYQRAGIYDFELYDQRFNMREPDKSEVDIYLPVKK
ncbi:MAG: GyrI-like domain-containing protein [Vulcanimicrobiota bacterium]